MAYYRYNKYKDCDIPWVKEIPEKWLVTEVRNVFSKNDIKNEKLEENNLLTLSYGSIKRKSINTAGGLLPASFDSYQILKKGMIVLRMLDLQNDKNSLRVGYVPERGIITSAYIGLDSKIECDTKYFYYLLHFIDLIKHFYNGGGGVRQSIGFTDFRREQIILPSSTEQTAIANFLDYKLEKIDCFIKKKKALIKLLTEQKAAIINQAVTKGINPKVKLKSSGIEWLGEIPEHWEVRKLKFLAKILNGKDCDKKDSGKYPVYGSGGIFGWNDDFLYDKPSVLLGRKGTIDKPQYVTAPFWSVDTAFYTKINEKIVAPLYFYFLCCNIPFGFYSSKTALPSMTQTDLYEAKFAIPSKEEQEKNINFITIEIQKIDKTISTIEKEIDLVEEYKTALIAEAVTGKIDVRDFKIPAVETPLTMVAEDAAAYNIKE
ncbi:MAG: restriction endonuclease subunit S [Polaribacter sp.]